MERSALAKSALRPEPVGTSWMSFTRRFRLWTGCRRVSRRNWSVKNNKKKKTPLSPPMTARCTDHRVNHTTYLCVIIIITTVMTAITIIITIAEARHARLFAVRQGACRAAVGRPRKNLFDYRPAAGQRTSGGGRVVRGAHFVGSTVSAPERATYIPPCAFVCVVVVVVHSPVTWPAVVRADRQIFFQFGWDIALIIIIIIISRHDRLQWDYLFIYFFSINHIIIATNDRAGERNANEIK